jgi:hypothetical protein
MPLNLCAHPLAHHASLKTTYVSVKPTALKPSRSPHVAHHTSLKTTCVSVKPTALKPSGSPHVAHHTSLKTTCVSVKPTALKPSWTNPQPSIKKRTLKTTPITTKFSLKQPSNVTLKDTATKVTTLKVRVTERERLPYTAPSASGTRLATAGTYECSTRTNASMAALNTQRDPRPLDPLLVERVNKLCGELAADTSDYAIRPIEPELLHQAVTDMFKAMQNSYAASTQKGDRGANWNHWSGWCQSPGIRTNPVRPFIADKCTAFELERENFLLAGAICWILIRMKGRGRKWPLPSSALKVLEGIRRLHVIKGYAMPPLTQARRVVKGTCNLYVMIHGPESLQPHRKEPIPFTVIVALMKYFASHTDLLAYTSSELLRTLLLALVATLTQSGMRKGEVGSVDTTFTLGDIAKSNLAWRINGVTVTDPTREELLSMVSGRDHAILKPPPSKTDQLGVLWGNRPIYLPYRTDMEVNAAKALRDLELLQPTHGTARRLTPLFMYRGAPITSYLMDKLLKQALLVVAPLTAAGYSWHSFRIQLACSLLKAGKRPDEIMALCRWQSEESLRTYARLGWDQYSDLLYSAYDQDISQIDSHNLPVTIDEAEMVASLLHNDI